VQLQPNALQRGGAVVGVVNNLDAREPLLLRIERRMDDVVGAVLPVGASWSAIARAIGVRGIRQCQRREGAPRIVMREGSSRGRGSGCRSGRRGCASGGRSG